MKAHREGKITLRIHKVAEGDTAEGGFEADQGHAKEAELLEGHFCTKLRINERTPEKFVATKMGF